MLKRADSAERSSTAASESRPAFMRGMLASTRAPNTPSATSCTSARTCACQYEAELRPSKFAGDAQLACVALRCLLKFLHLSQDLHMPVRG